MYSHSLENSPSTFEILLPLSKSHDSVARYSYFRIHFHTWKRAARKNYHTAMREKFKDSVVTLLFLHSKFSIFVVNK